MVYCKFLSETRATRPHSSLFTSISVLGFKKLMLKLSLCFMKHHTMKTYGEVEVKFHTFLT